MKTRYLVSAALALLLFGLPVTAQQPAPGIPLPEHPRPDFERAAWQNLNGSWDFAFDAQNTGAARGWSGALPSARKILVPFPWGSPLSGVPDSAEIAWYARPIEVPLNWQGRRIFLVIGAADWHTTAWLDGRQLGTHQGGYTPFEFELTSHIKPGQTQQLVIRVDDAARPFKLEGKQGYGNARGIWQTPYLEVRGDAPLKSLHFTPRTDQQQVQVFAQLMANASKDLTLTMRFKNAALPAVTQQIPAGHDQVKFDVSIPNARLWTLDEPFLYEVSVSVAGPGLTEDRVDSYFGMRKISVVNLPGTDYPYIALNDQPIYLQLALDQAYHPEGFYTFPSDAFMRDEILRAKQIGLNGLREHVKIELPRKLYWADKLGMLIMADVPNAWGEPSAEMRADVEYALRQMIARDYNHPSIFSWIPFNEAWGLTHKEGNRAVYRPETQRWVASVYRLTKALDPTRLVEDNSPCCGRGHTETDINSWHAYLPGWAWDEQLRIISDSTYPGSPWNFEEGYQQERQPNINSEFGNVWGYERSTGDVDWSWDYHLAVDAFRRYPKIAGWLYTEHHDVINEWNGYWRYDRSNKETGLGELVDGMSLRDLHAPFYIAVGKQLSQTARPGERVVVPLHASFMSGSHAHGDSLRLYVELYGWNGLGQKHTYWRTVRNVLAQPYLNAPLPPLEVVMPGERAVAILATRLQTASGTVLQRNFTTFVVDAPVPLTTQVGDRTARVLQIDPAKFADAKWSLKQWTVLDSLKINGAGAGFFEYRLPWPTDLKAAALESVAFVAEVSAKQLFGKDRENAGQQQGDFMRGKGTHDPSLNRNAYPMTDEKLFPSAVVLRVNGVVAGEQMLTDDPADHRGILSWHYQKRDRLLREAGSYGELMQISIPRAALERAEAAGELVIRLEVGDALPGGLAIYGKQFGRYPLDPTLIFLPRNR